MVEYLDLCVKPLEGLGEMYDRPVFIKFPCGHTDTMLASEMPLYLIHFALKSPGLIKQNYIRDRLEIELIIREEGLRT